jgi:hypothetical protein
MPRKSRPVQLGLDGQPIKDEPRRTVVSRCDGPGWTIRVRVYGSACEYVGVYATEGEAWQALRAGEGKPIKNSEDVTVSVWKK